MKKSFYIYVALSILTGLLIAWNDTRPYWDDTAISVFLIITSAAFFAFLAGKKPWLFALSVGIWIPLFNFFNAYDYKFFLILIPAFIGAYINFFMKKIIIN